MNRRPLLASMTGAGLIVVGSLAVAFLIVVGTVCARFVKEGHLDSDGVAWALGLSNVLVATLSRTRPDPGTDDGSMQVVAPPSSTVTVDSTPTDPPPGPASVSPARHRLRGPATA